MEDIDLETVNDLAERYGISIRAMYAYIHRNKIKPFDKFDRTAYYNTNDFPNVGAVGAPKPRKPSNKVDPQDLINQLQTQIACLEQARARDLAMFKTVLGQLHNRIKALENA